MPAPKREGQHMFNYYNIFIETKDGRQLRSFTWRGRPETGIARAHEDAKLFGYSIARAWAEQIDQ